MVTENKQPIFPYVSYPAFKSFIAHLHDTVVTDQIDHTMMPRAMSGAVRTAVISALKSLGLINAEGNTSKNLKDLVDAYDTKKWPDALKEYVLSAYSGLFGNIDLKTVTRKQIDDLFQETSAEMREKYIRFFLSVNKEAGIEYSPHLKIRRRSTSKRTNKATQKDKDFGGQANPQSSGSGSEQTPDGFYDCPIPIASEKPCFIRIPLSITTAQAGMVKAVLPVIDAMAKNNEENKQ